MHAFLRCKHAWCKCNSETLNTEYFQQGQLSLIQKITRDLFLTKTYDLDIWSQAWSKRKHTSHLDQHWCQYFCFSHLLFDHLMRRHFSESIFASGFDYCALLWAWWYTHFVHWVSALSSGPNLGASFALPPRLARVIVLLTLQWSMKSLFRFFKLWQMVPFLLVLQLSQNLPPLGSLSLVSSFPHLS